MDVLYGLAKDFVFREAVAFLKGKRALTSEEYRLLDDESRAKAFHMTVPGCPVPPIRSHLHGCFVRHAFIVPCIEGCLHVRPEDVVTLPRVDALIPMLLKEAVHVLPEQTVQGEEAA